MLSQRFIVIYGHIITPQRVSNKKTLSKDFFHRFIGIEPFNSYYTNLNLFLIEKYIKQIYFAKLNVLVLVIRFILLVIDMKIGG